MQGNESRARVVFNLPLNNAPQERAVIEIIGYLQGQRGKGFGIDGFTHSDKTPPVFKGWWWDEEKKEWIEDNLVMFMVDYLTPSAKKQFSLYDEITQLKTKISETYKQHAGAEKEVWVVSHAILRQE
jgi:hypothetical protein